MQILAKRVPGERAWTDKEPGENPSQFHNRYNPLGGTDGCQHEESQSASQRQMPQVWLHDKSRIVSSLCSFGQVEQGQTKNIVTIRTMIFNFILHLYSLSYQTIICLFYINGKIQSFYWWTSTFIYNRKEALIYWGLIIWNASPSIYMWVAISLSWKLI